MELIKQLETHRNHSIAQVKTYHNVTFPGGFVDFLDGLYFSKLSPKHFQRKVVEGYHCWFDSVGQGGIMLATTEHPMTKNEFAGDVTVCGSKDVLIEFEQLLELHDVEYEGKTQPEDVELKHQYHDELNPELWDDKTLKPEVREKLMKAANAFVEFLKVPNLEVEDVRLTGSNANYNWTEASDIDLHIIVDFEAVQGIEGELVKEFFDAKKGVFNSIHKILMSGHEVEFYVQDSNEPHKASGVYSVQNDEWVTEPEHKEPEIDDAAIRAKSVEFMNQIDAVADCTKAAAVEDIMERLKKLRNAGLADAGEFSTENLVFKQLRHNGYLEKLSNCKTKSFDRELSIEDEEWGYLK